jgi:hypothetical protein
MLFLAVLAPAIAVSTCPPCSPVSYGTAGWSGTGFVEIQDIPSYPDVIPVPESRNRGWVAGSALLLTSKGFIVTETGDYFATLSAVLYGNETAEEKIEYNIFLIRNNNFSSTDVNIAGSSNTVDTNQVVQFDHSNFVRLQRGDEISLVINNGVGRLTSIKMFAWGLTLDKRSACLDEM